MDKLKNKLYKFLYGRYGVDNLYRFLLFVCLVLLVVNIFIKSRIITIIESIILIICIYRSLSKKKMKRKKENEKYLYLKKKIISFFEFQRRKYNDRNTYVYKRCPSCKQKIRLRLKKGKHTVKCPKCSNCFSVRCYRNEKNIVEIVK